MMFGSGMYIMGSVGLATVTVAAAGLSSIGLSMPGIFAVSGSPLTANGSITVALQPQLSSTFLGAPAGSSGIPSFRPLVAADIPQIPGSLITSGVVHQAYGGTGINGSAMPQGALLLGNGTGYSILALGTTGYVLTSSGGNVVWAPASGGSVGGTSGQLQFNNGGAMGGADISWSAVNDQLTFNRTSGSSATSLYFNTSSRKAIEAYSSTTGGNTGTIMAFNSAANSNSVALYAVVTGSSNSPKAIMGTATGNTQAYAIYGQSSGFAAFLGGSVEHTVTIVGSDNLTSNNFKVLTIDRATSGTPALGFGVALLARLKSSTTPSMDAAMMTTAWSVVTHATRSADIIFSTVFNAGSLSERLRIIATGSLISTQTTTLTGAIADSLVLNVNSTGTVAAGFGQRFVMGLQTSTTTGVEAAVHKVEWAVATHVGREATYTVSIANASYAGMIETLRMYGQGFTRLSVYGVSNSSYRNALELRAIAIGTTGAGHGVGLEFQASTTGVGAQYRRQGSIRSAWLDETEPAFSGMIEFGCEVIGVDYPVFDIRRQGGVSILNLKSGAVIAVNGVKVLGARDTGWTPQTATPSKADLGSNPTNAQLASWAAAMQASDEAHGFKGS